MANHHKETIRAMDLEIQLDKLIIRVQMEKDIHEADHLQKIVMVSLLLLDKREVQYLIKMEVY